MKGHWLKLIFLLLLSFPSMDLVGQDNTQREEVQRYFGYEVLPYRYISLPYDVSVNANERGVFVDIGPIYFMFLPMFLIGYLMRNRWMAVGSLLSTIFIWIIGTSNSYVYSKKLVAIDSDKTSLSEYLLGKISFDAEPLSHVTAYLYFVGNTLYAPFKLAAESLSGDADFLTYPLLIILFLFGTWLVHKLTRAKEVETKAPILVYWVFLFFWFKYSAGIPWYGFFFFFMSLMTMLMFVESKSYTAVILNRFLKWSFLFVGSIFIALAIAFRISDVTTPQPLNKLGTTMFSPHFFAYQTGAQSGEKVLSDFYPQFSEALAQMNSEQSSLILRIGTSFSYFVKNNSFRIKMDNQLGFFDQMDRTYQKDKSVMNAALKASNFKYIIIDVNTPYIDQTPEQSLKKKYDALMNYVKDNPGLRLMCTNRQYRVRNPRGGYMTEFAMFPDKSKGATIYYGGQYAIYEIL